MQLELEVPENNVFHQCFPNCHEASSKWVGEPDKFLINVFPQMMSSSLRESMGLFGCLETALVEILEKLGSCANTRFSDNSLLMATLK